MTDRVPFLDVGASYRELRPELNAAVARVLDSGWYVLGRELEAFEAEWAAYCAARFCVGLANGLESLALSLQALDLQPGDEVLVPANTYIATWLAVSQVGGIPVPVEPAVGTWNMDPNRIEEAISPHTRVILPVHLFGQPADLRPILEIANRHGLRVLEDAAQAHGAGYRGKPIGAHGDVVAWSFYPGKNLGCFGDGGAVTTDDQALASRIRVLRNYGSRRKYENETKGRNSRLDEIHAAVLRTKLPHLDAWNARRRLLAHRYLKSLSELPGLALPVSLPGAEHAWHLFVVDLEDRDSAQDWLERQGIETLIHYPLPPHRSGAYRSDRPWGELPITDRAAATHLSLPIGPHLSHQAQDRVIDALRSFLTRIG